MLDTARRLETTLPLRAWLLACAAPESVGMTAASGAARLSEPVGAIPGLGIVVAGGLVEGIALGTAQARRLHTIAPALRVRRYVALTVLVAGLGWAAASAPAALSDDGPAPSPHSPW